MPTAHRDSRFSTPGAEPVAWEKMQQGLGEADVYRAFAVRADGRPHVTPLLAVVLDDVLHFFCTVGEPYSQTCFTFPSGGGGVGPPEGSEGA
jgi:hypothetical protein